MPNRNRIDALIALVEQGKFVAALEEFYLDDASMQENAGEPLEERGERRVERRQWFGSRRRRKCLCRRREQSPGTEDNSGWRHNQYCRYRNSRIFR